MAATLFGVGAAEAVDAVGIFVVLVRIGVD